MQDLIMTDPIGTDFGPGAPSDREAKTWIEASLEAEETSAEPPSVQRPVKPGHIFIGLCVAITVFGTMMTILALSAGTLMQKPHVAGGEPTHHAAAGDALIDQPPRLIS